MENHQIPNSPKPSKPHFLVITFPAQGHLNPALDLAKRLASSSSSSSAAVTFSTAAPAHLKMFPSLPSPTSPIHLDGVTYIPFSTGSSSLLGPGDPDHPAFISQMTRAGSAHLASILRSLASSGRPVTCLIYTIMLRWAADVAADLHIPTALYWIQAAHVLSIYHHFFHGHEPLVASHAGNPSFPISLPSLPRLRIRDLPSFLTITSPDDPFAVILDEFRGLFRYLAARREAGERPRVLVNSFDELETDVLGSMEEHMELVTVGPSSPNATTAAGDMFEEDEREYMGWLDSQEEKSVVYVAFGSVQKMGKEEVEEIGRGLSGSRRPYLWVVRKDWRGEDGGFGGGGKEGMVVEWCKQGRVLGHKAVGCFVTHCGWNSTVEGLVSGVPVVAMPSWSDQVTNAWLMEREWGVAVKAEVGENGRVGWEELKRCLDVVMGEGERGVEIRRNAAKWKERARKAVDEGGSSWRNLKKFVVG